MFQKSMVLSDNSSNKKAVLSLQSDEVGMKGTLRLYNFSQELGGVSSLGIYTGQKVVKAGLTRKSHMLYQFFLDEKQLPEQFSVAVVNFQNAVAKPILFGSSKNSQEEVYASIISQISENGSMKNAENALDKFGVDFDEPEKKEIEKEIDNALCNQNCADCFYKKYFYDSQKQNEESDPEIVVSKANSENSLSKQSEQENEEEEKIQEVDEDMFFLRLKPQIDKLFESNPPENNLQDLIPSSKFVKVEYEDEGDFYVFGLLYDEGGNVKYVCYGVPAVFEENPPAELSGYPIWLPLDKENGFGYWLTYQDAATGEPVKAIIE